MEYTYYNDVPWHRKNGINTASVLLGFFLFPPLLWFVLYTLMTGDVYFNKTHQDGNLKKWSKANKAVAWILVILQLFFIIVRYIM